MRLTKGAPKAAGSDVMRANLSELLGHREIVHPTVIERVEWSGDALALTASGVAWWKRAYSEDREEGVIRLVFEGLGEGAIRTDEFDLTFDEALEDFSVTPGAEVDWAQPSEWSVFCSGPIPSPLDVYVLVHDFLWDRDACKSAKHFLNNAERISSFVDITRTSGFLLGSGPACIRDILCAELVRQNVPHNVIHMTAGAHPGYLVRLGSSGFLCRAAEAVWEDKSLD